LLLFGVVLGVAAKRCSRW